MVPTMSPKHISNFNDPIAKPLSGQANTRQRILVVEDEHDLRQLAAEVLLDAGYLVDVARDGAAAWTALQHSHYDLLITDQFMPRVSGVELLRKIHSARMNLPVIMATGFLPTWEFVLNPCLQEVKMLLKPYSLGKLLDMVKNVLSQTARARNNAPLSGEGTMPFHTAIMGLAATRPLSAGFVATAFGFENKKGRGLCHAPCVSPLN